MTQCIYNPDKKGMVFHEAVPECTPDVLYDFGQDATLVPTFAGLSFSVDGDTFTEGAMVHVGLTVETIHRVVGLDGIIKEHDMNTGTKIDIRNRVMGGAAMWLVMTERKGGGTLIHYGLSIRAGRLALPGTALAVERLIKGKVGKFAALYKANILRSVPDSQKLAQTDAISTVYGEVQLCG